MKTRSIVPFLVTVMAMAGSAAVAQSDKKPERKMERKPAEPVKIEGAMPAMPKPAPELAQLKWFAGTWRCQGDVPATPMGPAHKSRSTATIRPDLGGFWYSGVVREDKTADTPHPVHGMFHQTYDTAKKQFVMLWVDNYGGWATQTSRGWDGDKMVFDGEGALGGQTMRMRETFVKKGEREVNRKFEMQTNGRWTTAADEVCRKAMGPGLAKQ